MSNKDSPVYSFAKDADVNLLFPPLGLSVEQAKADINTVIASPPALYDKKVTRWTLKNLLIVLQNRGYKLTQIGCLHRFLTRLHFRWVKARYSLRSPDPLYQEKNAYIDAIKKRVKESNHRETLLYLDECNYYRQPTLTKSWTTSDHAQEKAKRAYKSDHITRVLGVIDACDGHVMYFQAPKIRVSDHANFYKKIRNAYPHAEKIWIVQDNLPVHFHPNLLTALEPQENPFAVILAPNWSSTPKQWAIERFGKWNLPIQLVSIPTYAPWCNPIEKLWRLFKQECIHLHCWAEDLETLRTKAQQFFDQFAQGSASLLRYVGLGAPY